MGDLYKCGVDIVGPSNIKTLLDSIPSYWGPLRNDMLKKIGDVDADPAFNERISPLFHVDDIAAPLLIGQGRRVREARGVDGPVSPGRGGGNGRGGGAQVTTAGEPHPCGNFRACT